jgi:predicted fused transcriptional regulator/phosphomethylpyrimidine kinase
MIPYHEGRRNEDEVAKLKGQIERIWDKTRAAAEV